jgi:hypothetical protein
MRHLLLAPLLLAPLPVHADAVQITDAKATPSGDGYRFDVTLLHGDTGWDHYADGWSVVDADGNELGYRKLAHPHVNEQPFTRSLSGVVVPDGVTTVYIRAHDSVHGWTAEEFEIDLE